MLKIGRILKPVGIHGDLKVQFFINDWDELRAFDRIWVDHPLLRGEYLEVREFHFKPFDQVGMCLFASPFCEDRSHAESFRMRYLYIREESLPPLEAGEFYLKDLLGAEVVDAQTLIGYVTHIFDVAGVDTLLIRRDSGREFALPFRDPYVRSVDTRQKQIYVTQVQDFLE